MASLKVQFLLYCFVGGISCFVDVGLFLLLTGMAQMEPILATSLSFTAATLVNYALCLKYIFATKAIHPFNQILRIFFVAGIGLIFNAAILALLLHFTPLPSIGAKLLAIPAVLVWNFLGRRTFVYAPEIPSSTLASLNKLLPKK